jgi:hypothetical protein
LRYQQPPKKEDEQFDDFMFDLFDSLTNLQDPGDADGTLADLTSKFNSLLATLRENGLMR